MNDEQIKSLFETSEFQLTKEQLKEIKKFYDYYIEIFSNVVKSFKIPTRILKNDNEK